MPRRAHPAVPWYNARRKELGMARLTMKVDGMSCSGCARSVERKLMNTMGVKDAAVDLAAKEAAVEFEDEKVDPAALKAAVESLGFKVG
jgi:copper chaperone CopZ